jgi:hypothetical protein
MDSRRLATCAGALPEKNLKVLIQHQHIDPEIHLKLSPDIALAEPHRKDTKIDSNYGNNG